MAECGDWVLGVAPEWLSVGTGCGDWVLSVSGWLVVRSRSADTPPPEERQRQHGERRSQPYPLDDAAADSIDRSSVEEMLAQVHAPLWTFSGTSCIQLIVWRSFCH